MTSSNSASTHPYGSASRGQKAPKRRTIINPELEAINLNCNGRRHTIVILNGYVRLVNHTKNDLEAERILVELGGRPSKCGEFLNYWRRPNGRTNGSISKKLQDLRTKLDARGSRRRSESGRIAYAPITPGVRSSDMVKTMAICSSVKRKMNRIFGIACESPYPIADYRLKRFLKPCIDVNAQFEFEGGKFLRLESEIEVNKQKYFLAVGRKTVSAPGDINEGLASFLCVKSPEGKIFIIEQLRNWFTEFKELFLQKEPE